MRHLRMKVSSLNLYCQVKDDVALVGNQRAYPACRSVRVAQNMRERGATAVSSKCRYLQRTSELLV